MRPGPAPIPTALKIAAGNPGRRPLNDREPNARIISKLPNAPREFPERAAKCWREIGNGLIHAGVMTELGMPALFRYCVSTENYHTARAKVQELGMVIVNQKTGAAHVNPYFIAQTMAQKDLRQLECEFGMLPASASRVKAANPQQLDLFGRLFESDDADGLLDDELVN